MKIGLFSNAFWGLQKPNARSAQQKLQAAMTAFKKQHVAMCFCVGDLIYQKNQNRLQILNSFHEALELIRSYNIPFYLVPGPYDYRNVSAQDLLESENLYTTPYTIQADDYCFTVLDGNYRTDGKYSSAPNAEQAELCLPTAYTDYLKHQIRIAQKTVVLLYQNLDSTLPSKYRLSNAESVRTIIKNVKRVNLVIQGGYPQGADTEIDGIRYLSLPSMYENETDFYKIVDLI